MWSQWNDIDNTFAAMDELRRRVERAWGGWNVVSAGEVVRSGPRFEVVDTGTALVLTADVPGLSEKDVQVTLTAELLSVSGERKVSPPEGYTAHRQERTPMRFTRTFELPDRIDTDAVTATVKNGVLTVSLPKAPERQPRQIAVKAG
jgi:HSP20 family protein